MEEITKISVALFKTKSNTGKLPETLKELIGNNPQKKTWESDYWNNKYVYKVQKNNFTITSFGVDGILNTNDDIKIKSSEFTQEIN